MTGKEECTVTAAEDLDLEEAFSIYDLSSSRRIEIPNLFFSVGPHGFVVHRLPCLRM
jgi:hypothetical protein